MNGQWVVYDLSAADNSEDYLITDHFGSLRSLEFGHSLCVYGGHLALLHKMKMQSRPLTYPLRCSV